MSVLKYEAYYATFGLTNGMRSISGKEIRGIWAVTMPVGEANMHILFRDMGIILDVKLVVLPEYIPSVLSMKDMI